MELSNSFKIETQENLLSQGQDQSSSRFAKKLTFFISLVILFTFIMGLLVSVLSILKHNAESKSLSANPPKAIRAVCHSYWYEYFEFGPSLNQEGGPLDSSDFCTKSISSLHSQNNYTNNINPSMIFLLYLQVSLSHIKNLQNEPLVGEMCNILLNESQRQLNRSLTLMGVDPDDTLLRDRESVSHMRSWIKNAIVDLEMCYVGGFEEKKFGEIGVFKVKTTRDYIKNSLEILDNVDNIYEMFYPPIGSVLGIDFLLSSDTFLNVAIFSMPCLVLVFLFGVLLRLYRYN